MRFRVVHADTEASRPFEGVSLYSYVLVVKMVTPVYQFRDVVFGVGSVLMH